MEKNLSIFSFKKMPKGFLVTILAILIFESFNAYFDNYFYNPSRTQAGLTIKIKNEISQSKESIFDILILGDSHTHFGIDPRFIEEKTGLSCFNFSLFSPQTLFGSYLIFDNYVKSHTKKPKYVIIGHVSFTTYKVTKSSFRENPILHIMDLRNGNMIAFIKEFGIVKGIKFLLPSLIHQSRFKDFIKNPFSFDTPDKTQINNIIKQIYLNKGFLQTRRKYKKSKTEYQLFFKENDLNKFIVSPFSYKYLINILELAKKNKIKPIYYVTALPPYVYNRLKEYPYMKQHDDFINSLKQNYPDLIVLRSQQVLNEEDIYLDEYHLSEKGIKLLSNFMAQEIQEINRRNTSQPVKGHLR